MSHQPAATGTSADCHTDTLAAGHSYSTADATQPAAAPRASKLEHYPSTSSADESIGELPAPRELGTLSRTLSSEPASPLSTGRSQASVPQPAAAWLSCYLIKCSAIISLADVSHHAFMFLFVCVISFTSTVTFNFQEFFSARDEPDPEITPVAGDAVKSPNPKYSCPVVLQF